MCPYVPYFFHPFSVFGLIFICQEEDDQMDNLINHILLSGENSRNEVFHHSLKMVHMIDDFIFHVFLCTAGQKIKKSPGQKNS